MQVTSITSNQPINHRNVSTRSSARKVAPIISLAAAIMHSFKINVLPRPQRQICSLQRNTNGAPSANTILLKTSRPILLWACLKNIFSGKKNQLITSCWFIFMHWLVVIFRTFGPAHGIHVMERRQARATSASSACQENIHSHASSRSKNRDWLLWCTISVIRQDVFSKTITALIRRHSEESSLWKRSFLPHTRPRKIFQSAWSKVKWPTSIWVQW